MTVKSKQVMQNGSRKEDNAFQRFLQLPVVNSACIGLQKTYHSTKESHPLVAWVCNTYERGVRAASSLAMWSMEPVVQKLEPQLAVANVLACQGLDLLEQRIPTLQKPVEEVTSELKDGISSHVQSAVHSVADALDWIWGLAADSYEQVQNTAREAAKGARSSQVSYLAEAGVEVAVGKVKKLVDILLPKPEHNSAHKDSGARVLREGFPSSILRRIRTLASNVSQHVYRETLQTIQHTRDKGQEWATWIPGLGGFIRQSSSKAQQVFSNIQETARKGAFEKEEERKNEDDRTNMTKESTEAQHLMGSLTRNVQTAYFSTVTATKGDHITPCGTAGQRPHVSSCGTVSEARSKVGVLWEILQTSSSSFLGTLFRYVPVSRLLVREEGTATVTTNGTETLQPQESSQPSAIQAQEREPHYQPREEWSSSRGHYPLSFLNLDEPHLTQQAPFQRRSPAFEANSSSARKSAFSPYKEAVGGRRLSEGLYRSSSEWAYGKVHHAGLHGGTVLKKD